ncbi:MAG TPA: hypothetical protein VLJ41_01610, partial [Segetibacter sp.]|nr:hypothetical protein [Segetibacter sp.]
MKKEIVPMHFSLSYFCKSFFCFLSILMLVHAAASAQDNSNDVFNANSIKSRMLKVTEWQLN